MWKRDSFHNCVLELKQLSARFCKLHSTGPADEVAAISINGVAILRALALAIRSEQDYDSRSKASDNLQVGAVDEACVDVQSFIKNYRPPFRRLTPPFRALGLRDALNRIAHANPDATGYRASAEIHELILSGERSNSRWLAILSIPDLCAVVRSLPDRRIPSGDRGP